MKQYGIIGTELSWFKSCVLSDEIITEFRVPRGAKLAAILFILYINDIKYCPLLAMIILFTDDTVLYVRAKNIEDAYEKK